MSAATMTDNSYIRQDMKGPLVSSAIFHVLIVVIAIVGLPYMTPELPDIDTSITVELVDSDEMKDMAKPPEPIKKQPPQNTAKEPPKPVMPQVTAKKPPKPVAPAPPEQIEEFAPPQEEKIAESVKKPEPVKKIIPPKPVKRPAITKNEEPQEEEFKSLLRNLMPEEQEAAKSEEVKKGEQPSPLERFSQSMNMGEMDALKRQLSQCWSVMAGARYAEDIVVDIRLYVNPDRSIRDAKIVNQMRYATDNYFRAAADGALRAVFRCSPLDLPPNKYDLWKTIVVTFDPRTML